MLDELVEAAFKAVVSTVGNVIADKAATKAAIMAGLKPVVDQSLRGDYVDARDAAVRRLAELDADDPGSKP